MKRILLPVVLLMALVFSATPALAHGYHHGGYGGYGHHHGFYGGFNGYPYYGRGFGYSAYRYPPNLYGYGVPGYGLGYGYGVPSYGYGYAPAYANFGVGGLNFGIGGGF